MKLFKNQKGNALSQSKGFTLIELLVVVGILAVLFAITLIAINPARQFSQANNTKRSSDVNAILNAVNQYMVDHQGTLPAVLSGCTAAVPCTLTDDPAITPSINICAMLVSNYLAALPADPLTNNGVAVIEAECSNGVTTYNTGYTIYQSTTNNRVTVAAPAAELSASISVTR
ncbi:MAG: type II secretion system protein [Candidatus Levybacteria bacterium]|nr:type II secretion system protein [Candidatus Levybacteria bacterium]